MALAKERNPNDHSSYSHISGLVHQSYKFCEIEDRESPQKKGNSTSLSTPGRATNSGAFLCRSTTNHQQQLHVEEGHSAISFKPGYYDNSFMQGGSVSCFLSFEENDEQRYSSNLSTDQQLMNLGSDSFDSLRLFENMNCVHSGGGIKETGHHEEMELESFAWKNSSFDNDYLATQETSFHKRKHSGENEQEFKKECTTNNSTKKTNQKSPQPKDPQSIAAKNRRERISERLKVLQDLVPNGSKVDSVTMLEKAISYVKFLQLQVKVLAADEFWPVQGGKPPELSQVKDAIDAILLSSQRDRNSSSK